MTQQQDFFSPNHDRLFKISVWAKYLAWAALIYYIGRAALVIIQYQVDLQRMYMLSSSSPGVVGLTDFFRYSPLYYSIDMISEMALAVLSGAIYYLVLKGISLGLNMIIETDINYRENKKTGVTE